MHVEYEWEYLTEDFPYPHQSTIPGILWGKPQQLNWYKTHRALYIRH